MKRIVILCALLINISILVGIHYYNEYSLSAVLKQDGFNKMDIVTIESLDETHTAFLLVNKNKISIKLINRNKFGVWSVRLSHTTNNTESANLNISTQFLPDELDSRQHVFLAKYVSEPYAHFEPIDFDLEVDYFSVNDKTVMFAHAAAHESTQAFATKEVLEYINTVK